MVSKNNINEKRGFTIIEVVLVLAIAGLIFLMVFIAFPALQRAQRNTQRRDDYSMLVTAINSYMSGNNGKLSNLLAGSTSGNGSKDLDATRWINTSGEDPSGNPYNLKVFSYSTWSGLGKDEQQPGIIDYEPKGDDLEKYPDATNASQVFVIIKANCQDIDDNGDAKPSEDKASRAFAVYGYLEGGGYFCQDSGATGKTDTSGGGTPATNTDAGGGTNPAP